VSGSSPLLSRIAGLAVVGIDVAYILVIRSQGGSGVDSRVVFLASYIALVGAALLLAGSIRSTRWAFMLLVGATAALASLFVLAAASIGLLFALPLVLSLVAAAQIPLRPPHWGLSLAVAPALLVVGVVASAR
jgi:hypothetical protein